MAEPLDLCMTDANHFGLFDYRFLNRLGNGQNIWVWSVLDMVNKGIAASNNANARIRSLYVNGHGAPGWQSVGAGTGGDTTGERSIMLDPDWYGRLLGVASNIGLTMLSECFTDDAVVTLSGCKVAAEGDGKALLRAVASATGAWVQAADANQYAWIPGWEGRVWKASPCGDILCPDGSYM